MRTAFIFLCLYTTNLCAQNVGIGTTTPNGQLQLSNLIANRKIVLFEGANNDHGFYGFGVNGGVLRYQVNTTGDNHVFYAGVTSTTSNELMRIQGNGLVGIGNSNPAYQLHVGNYASPSAFTAISTAGGHLYKAGLKLRHFDDNNGWTLESDESLNLFRILRHINNATGVPAFSIDQGGSILMGNSLDNSMGNIGIGTPILLNVKLYAKSTEDVTALVENTTPGKWALQSFGNTLLSNSLDNSQGNVYIGHSTLGTAKLYVKSNQDYSTLIENTVAGKIALKTVGNVNLCNTLDDAEGNVGIGITSAVNAKFFVQSNEEYTAAFKNLNFPNTALITLGHTVLTPTEDMANGNVGMGAGAGVNSKLHVKSNQDFGIFIESSSVAIAAYGHMSLIGNQVITGTSNVQGNMFVTGNISKGGGSFKIDHPLDPANKFLYHSFVESPDMMNVYNGNITTGSNGEVTVTLPDYFEALNKDFRYQLTVIGEFAQAIVYRKIKDNSFVIKTDKPNIEVSWQVTGIRQDKYAEQNRIPTEVNKTGDEKGKYLHPTAFGLPESMGIKQPEIKKLVLAKTTMPEVRQ